MFGLFFFAGGYSINGRSIHLEILPRAIELIKLDPGLIPPIRRVSRQVEASVPVAVTKVNAEEFEFVPRNEQTATTTVLNYVDFGGHTGENGAFGWYADFPVY